MSYNGLETLITRHAWPLLLCIAPSLQARKSRFVLSHAWSCIAGFKACACVLLDVIFNVTFGVHALSCELAYAANDV